MAMVVDVDGTKQLNGPVTYPEEFTVVLLNGNCISKGIYERPNGE